MSINMASSNVPAYRGPLWRLQDKLSPIEQADFQYSTLDDLHAAIKKIQEEQLKKQHLRALIKIKPFLQSMEQYDKVIAIFLNTGNILAFVWVCISQNPYLSYEYRAHDL